MKKVSYVIVFAFVFALNISLAHASGTRSAFNNYEINLVQDFQLGKHHQAMWTLDYGKNESTITIVKRKTFEGMEYRVQSEYFSVNYIVTPDGFGAKAAKSSWSSVPKKINNAVLNQDEMARQRILTQNTQLTDDTVLGLIASYLPDLINDGYTHLLN